jgi:hypothetical protein
MDYLPNDGQAQWTGVILNVLTFTPAKNHYIEFKVVTFPYKYDETLPGTSKVLNSLVDSYQGNGGFMPDWECNMPTLKPGDVNGDGSVDIIDIGILIDNYGKVPIVNSKADINGDGSVDIIDLGILIDNYGK